MNRIQLIQTILPLLYDWDTKTKEVVDSYSGKHDVEKLINFYISNSEFIEACIGLGIPHKKIQEPNYIFYMRRKWDMFFQRNNTTTRPRGYSIKKWEAYLSAKQQSDNIINDLIQNVEGDSTFQRLGAVVGY